MAIVSLVSEQKKFKHFEVRMRFIFFLIPFLFSLFILSPIQAVEKIAAGDPNAIQGGTLTYEAYEPDTINPITYKQVGATEILVHWIMETLLDNDMVSGEYIPRLAKKWEIGKDGMTFTFWLDERAKWFDGKPVTAEDVKFSFEVFTMKGVKAPFKKAQVANLESISIPKEGVIVFKSKKKLFSVFDFLAGVFILPKHLYYYDDPKKMESNEYTRAPKASGPYLVDYWKKGEKAVLKRNPNYWGKVLPQNRGAYNFDRVVIVYVRDPQIAFEKIKKGDLDYLPIRIGNTELIRQSKTDKAFTSGKVKAIAVNSRIQEGYGFLGYNLKNELFQDKRVRKALALAVNREEIIKKVLGGNANIPKGPLYSVANFAGKFVPVKYDPAESVRLLREAGWNDTDNDYIMDKNGKKFIFTVIVPNARIEKELLFVQNYWKKVGVQGNIKIIEYSSWKQLQDGRQFDALANGRGRTLNARDVDPFGEWHSSNTAEGLGNFYGYNNPLVDDLILKGRDEFDQSKRKIIFDELNDIVAEDYAMFQYSESKDAYHAINSSVVTPGYNGKQWFPYGLGHKYWYKK